MFQRLQYFIPLLIIVLYPVIADAQSLWGTDSWSIRANGAVLGTGIFGVIAGAFIAGLIVIWRKLPPQFFTWMLCAAFVLMIIIGETSSNALVIGATSSVSGFVGFAAGLAIIFAIFAETKEDDNKAPTKIPNVFGSAKWASIEDLKKWQLIKPLTQPQGLLVGGTANIGDEIIYDGKMHTLTIAPTQTGKGASFIIPNLLRLDASMLIVDPKGENARRTAKRRVAMGQNVKILDPWKISKDADKYGEGADPKLIAKYNPLDSLDADDPDLTTDTMMLADALTVDYGSQNQHFSNKAKDVISTLLLYLVTDKRETKTLGRLRDILSLPYDPDPDNSDTFSSILTVMTTSKHPMVRSGAWRIMNTHEEERSSVISTAQANTNFLDSPMLRESLESSDFSFEDLKLGEKNTTIYLVLPLDRLTAFNRWLRLLTVSALKDLMRIPHEDDQPSVRVMLDEFAALGRLEMVEQAFGTMAGLGVQLNVITQDLSQLERIYDKGWQTFISNAGVFQYYGSRDKMSAEYASSLCGTTTVKKVNQSWSFGRSASTTKGSSSGQSFSSSQSTTTGWNSGETTSVEDVAKPLIYPDQLMTLPEWGQVVFVENRDPIACRKVKWFEDQRLKALQNPKPENLEMGESEIPDVLKQATDIGDKIARDRATKDALKNTSGTIEEAAENRKQQREEAIETAKKVGATVGKGAKFMAEKLTEGQQKWKADIKKQESEGYLKEEELLKVLKNKDLGEAIEVSMKRMDLNPDKLSKNALEEAKKKVKEEIIRVHKLAND